MNITNYVSIYVTCKSGKSKPVGSIPKLTKQFYNINAGKNDIKGGFKDKYGNLIGDAYDLCPDMAFKGHTIAIIQLYDFDFSLTKNVLEKKGFDLHIWKQAPASIEEFQIVLKKSSQLWIISSQKLHLNASHLNEIKKYFETGKGIFIWGDNDPFYEDANYIANYLFGGRMYGNERGENCVGVQVKPNTVGFKKNHLITTGIVNLYEGSTIATIADTNDLEPLVYGSANNVIIAVYDKNGKRAIMDGGFSRLFYNWGSAGTGRYIANAAAWLVNVEKTKC